MCVEEKECTQKQVLEKNMSSELFFPEQWCHLIDGVFNRVFFHPSFQITNTR